MDLELREGPKQKRIDNQNQKVLLNLFCSHPSERLMRKDAGEEEEGKG